MDAATRTLSTRITIGLVTGFAVGLAANANMDPKSLDWFIKNVSEPLGRIFIRLIFMVTIPLIVCSILTGVKQMGDVRRLGRVGWQCVALTMLLAVAGVTIGIALVNLFQPGTAMDAEARTAIVEKYRLKTETDLENLNKRSGWPEVFLNLIPTNPLAEAVNAFNPSYNGGGLIALMVFSLIVGIAASRLDDDSTVRFFGLCEEVLRIAMEIISLAMYLAPFGVACLAFGVAAQLGIGIVATLGSFVAVVVGGLALHLFGFYGLVLLVLARVSPVWFFRRSQEALLTAFSTSSSNATLPVSMRVAERELGIRPQNARFVLTIGATANQNGTALFEGVTVLFLAQVFGHQLDLGQQILVAGMATLAGIGTAGVPGGSIPLIMGVLQSVGIPAESIALILGIDRILDMCRTVVNVAGDLVIATVVDRAEVGNTSVTSPTGDIAQI